DSWRPPAGTEFFLRFDLSDAIGNLRHNLAQLEQFHVLTRGRKPEPEPEPVHPLDAIEAMFGNEQLYAAFEDVVRYGHGTIQLVLTRPAGEPMSGRLDTEVRHIPFLDIASPILDDLKVPADRPSAVSRKEVNARLRLKHPLKGLKATDPDLYRAVKSALAKRAAASRRRQ